MYDSHDTKTAGKYIRLNIRVIAEIIRSDELINDDFNNSSIEV